ncbi:MAG: hypothetical protein WAK17_08745, partial [Candidatus Nitrosopolaris sp.]
SDRQQRLNGMLHKLIRLAEIFNIAVVITNQVPSRDVNSLDNLVGIVTKTDITKASVTS